MKNTAQFQNTFQSHNMKSFFEFLFAWVLGIVIPVLVYIKMIAFLIILDCVLGTWIAYRNNDFKWKKFVETIGKGVAFCLLLVAFQYIYVALSIPDIDINSVKFTIVTFLAGMMAYHEAKSIEVKTSALWGFSFLKPLEKRFKMFSEFNDSDTDTEKKD